MGGEDGAAFEDFGEVSVVKDDQLRGGCGLNGWKVNQSSVTDLRAVACRSLHDEGETTS